MIIYKNIFAFALIASLAMYFFYQPSNYERSNRKTQLSHASVFPINAKAETETLPPQRVTPIRISGDILFAGEKVPLNDLDVREKFDRELMVNTFWHSNTFLNIKLANKYFETIERILNEEGVPLDFKYLAVAESGLRNVVSPAKARGMWQIMKNTGTHYGLVINDEVDERYHLEKSTRAACKYLTEAKQKFGSWALAAASYNMGMPKLQQRLNEQYVTNYYDLALNNETSRYLYRILAYKMVFENTSKYGLHVNEEDYYTPLEYETINIGGTIDDLASFAISKNTTYKMLKVANPWLRAKKLTVKNNEVYTLKIPKNYIN